MPNNRWRQKARAERIMQLHERRRWVELGTAISDGIEAGLEKINHIYVQMIADALADAVSAIRQLADVCMSAANVRTLIGERHPEPEEAYWW